MDGSCTAQYHPEVHFLALQFNICAIAFTSVACEHVCLANMQHMMLHGVGLLTIVFVFIVIINSN